MDSADRRLARSMEEFNGIKKIIDENKGNKQKTWTAMKKYKRFIKSPLSEVKRLDNYDKMYQDLKDTYADQSPPEV
jgi:hypothetical protein